MPVLMFKTEALATSPVGIHISKPEHPQGTQIFIEDVSDHGIRAKTEYLEKHKMCESTYINPVKTLSQCLQRKIHFLL